MRTRLHAATQRAVKLARQVAVRVHGIVRPNRLRPCPFCGRYPEIEYLAGYPCVRHVINTDDCPMSPVVGWSVCVWQDRVMATRFAPSVPTDDPHEGPTRPSIVCLCGSTRFVEAFRRANLQETLAGKIVLSIGCNTKTDSDLMAAGELTEELKHALDELHKRKIDLADEVLVLNVGGYVGTSTRCEIEYARRHNKLVRWLETPADQVAAMTRRIAGVLATANNALYFNDASDYRTALWDVCLACGAAERSIGVEYIEYNDQVELQEGSVAE